MITPAGIRDQDQPSLSHALVRAVRANLSEEIIHKFLFGHEFVGVVTTTKFEYQIRIVRSRKTIRDINHRDQTRELARWVA